MVKIYQEMIKEMSQESKLYYINLGVKNNDLTQAQAGYLIYINNL